MSRARLSGYDNILRDGGACAHQGPVCGRSSIYAADAESLTCASCNPSGQRPLGRSNLSLIMPRTGVPPFPQLGNLSAEGHGRLFFESQDALTPRDTNGERPGRL